MSPLWRARLRLVVELVVVIYIVAQSYQGRVDIHTYQLAGCARGTLDRYVDSNSQLADAQRELLLSTDSDLPTLERNAHASSSRAHYAAYDSLLTRTAGTPEGRRAFCRRAYPAPSLWP